MPTDTSCYKSSNSPENKIFLYQEIELAKIFPMVYGSTKIILTRSLLNIDISYMVATPQNI